MSGLSDGASSPQLLSAWAKSDSEGRSLSLVRHAADACAVGAYLFDHWLPASVRELIGEGRTEDEARALVQWLAGGHDAGKLSPAFACQVDPLAATMRDVGLRITARRCDRRRKDFPHSLVGQYALEAYLCGRGWRRTPDARSYAVVAGGHHGVPPSAIPTRLDSKMGGGPEWDVVRTEFLDYVGRISRADQYLDSWSQHPLTSCQQAVLTGVVIIADWLASNAGMFPLGTVRDAIRHATTALADLALPPPWRAEPVGDAAQALGAFGLPEGSVPNAMQSLAVEVTRGLGGQGLLIIEAPMGSGKTEAALMAAQQFAAAAGEGGLFVAMPTMATSNAMFSRVLSWLCAQPHLGRASVVLAHGKADLNDDYRGLAPVSRLEDVERECPDHGSAIVAHQWLSGRKKGLLANFAVGTIDQLLFMALQARHVVLRHLALAGKVVVIDEVHAADHYMREYLKRALEWLAAYRVPVILLSATLPSEQRTAFAESYARGAAVELRDREQLTKRIYPSVTAIAPDGGVLVATTGAASPPFAVRLQRLDDDHDALIALLSELLSEGGCAAVLRNTVRRAQETSHALREVFGDEVLLLHSAFIAQHRADLERQLLAELGREGHRPPRRIVVATQVVEQSLDVDFDVVVTDLAPIDLVLQRIGRLHRHSRPRKPSLTQPCVYVTGVVDWHQPVPQPVQPSARVYRRYDLLRALAVLRDRDTLQLPDDIAVLVQAAYAIDFEPPRGWEDHLVEARTQSENQIRELVSRANDFRIRGPHDDDDLVGFLKNIGSDPDDVRGYARVRDGNDSVEVIVTRRVGDDVLLPARCGGTPIPIHFEPDDHVARRALTATIKLPYVLSLPSTLDRVITELERRTHRYDGWRTSKWLTGELALELDGEMRTELCGFDIRYDSLDGLIVEEAGR